MNGPGKSSLLAAVHLSPSVPQCLSPCSYGVPGSITTTRPTMPLSKSTEWGWQRYL
jgi:hypothetical protein